MGIKLDILKQACASKNLKYVGGRGNPRSPIWIVGEAPGENEELEGVAFVGYAGKQLVGQIEEAGLRQEDIYFTNPYQVRPPGNDIKLRGVNGIPDQIYLDAFWEELDEFKPTFVVAAGATPLSILCPFTVSKKDGTPRISVWRGSLLSSPFLGWSHYVIPMYHPSFILREYSERCIAVFCLDRVKEEFDFWKASAGSATITKPSGLKGVFTSNTSVNAVNRRLQPLPQRQLIDDPTADDVMTYLWDCLNAPVGRKISVDMENPYYKKIHIPYVMNFAYSAQSAISFNLWDYPLSALAKIWRLMSRVLAERMIIGQNYINFDIRYLEESVGLRSNINGLDDTMTRHKVLWPEFEHALHFQTIQYTREPYYKDEGHDWDFARGSKALRTYGAKDAAVTYEVWGSQETELDERGLRDFYERIEMPLARNMYVISNRGISVDKESLGKLRTKVINYLQGLCKDAEKFTGCPVFFDQDSAKDYQREAKAFVKKQNPKAKIKMDDVKVFNLGSPKQVLNLFDNLNIYLPSADGTRKTDEESMQKSFAKTGHDLPKIILQSRGLNKLKGTNIDANLRDDTIYTNYFTTGTVNGRRSSSGLWDETPFVYGTNLQNLPKHGKGIIGDFQKEYRECLIARYGKIFVAADQVQAEDWVVQGIIADISGQRNGLDELLNGVDRHRKLAAFIFNKSEAECGKDSHERYLGKKTRHAGNYDMQAFRFSVVLAKEGFFVPEEGCELLLAKFHGYDPGIKQVFHRFIQRRLEETRTLRNSFGRERIFFGLHPYRDNTKVFKEAYSTLPQSTVSDNTAQAVNIVETVNLLDNRFPIVKEDHDAIASEIEDDPQNIADCVAVFEKAFDRIITFENGLKIKIPIEFEMGYNLRTMQGFTLANLEEVHSKVRATRAAKELASCPV